MCGGQPDDVLQGMDCSDLALGSDTKVNEGVVAELHSVNWTDPLHPLRMCVNERWKYVESQDDSDEPYDLQDDPLEVHNQVRNPAYRKQVERSQRAFRPATLARTIA